MPNWLDCKAIECEALAVMVESDAAGRARQSADRRRLRWHRRLESRRRRAGSSAMPTAFRRTSAPGRRALPGRRGRHAQAAQARDIATLEEVSHALLKIAFQARDIVQGNQSRGSCFRDRHIIVPPANHSRCRRVVKLIVAIAASFDKLEAHELLELPSCVTLRDRLVLAECGDSTDCARLAKMRRS